jgi:hypothetical protein
VLAEKIIQLATAGERNPDLLCENALNDLHSVLRANMPTSVPERP